jgi:hypothetical protein
VGTWADAICHQYWVCERNGSEVCERQLGNIAIRVPNLVIDMDLLACTEDHPLSDLVGAYTYSRLRRDIIVLETNNLLGLSCIDSDIVCACSVHTSVT